MRGRKGLAGVSRGFSLPTPLPRAAPAFLSYVGVPSELSWGEGRERKK